MRKHKDNSMQEEMKKKELNMLMKRVMFSTLSVADHSQKCGQLEVTMRAAMIAFGIFILSAAYFLFCLTIYNQLKIDILVFSVLNIFAMMIFTEHPGYKKISEILR